MSLFAKVRETEVSVNEQERLAKPVYLGDAVYASFDGYHIWLKTGDGNNQQIALEPAVYEALVRYAKQIWRFK